MENKRLRFWKMAFVVLVVLNICLVVTFSYRVDWSGKRDVAEKPDEYIIRKVGLTDTQVIAYKVLRNSHHDSMITLNAAGRQLRRAFFDGLKATADKQQADSIANLIAANQKEIELVTYNHFAQVRALCTDKQKVIFDDIIQDVLRKMSGPPHRPHPGGYGGEGPPPDGERPPGPDRGNDDGPPPGR